jgi:hypothetical protein
MLAYDLLPLVVLLKLKIVLGASDLLVILKNNWFGQFLLNLRWGTAGLSWHGSLLWGYVYSYSCQGAYNIIDDFMLVLCLYVINHWCIIKAKSNIKTCAAELIICILKILLSFKRKSYWNGHSYSGSFF